MTLFSGLHVLGPSAQSIQQLEHVHTVVHMLLSMYTNTPLTSSSRAELQANLAMVIAVLGGLVTFHTTHLVLLVFSLSEYMFTYKSDDLNRARLVE